MVLTLKPENKRNMPAYTASSTSHGFFMSLPSIRPSLNASLRTSLAGGLAGATIAISLHPLDTAKSLRQTSPKLYASGIVASLRHLAKNSPKGLMAWYAGITPALWGSMISSAIYFGTYETIRALTMALWRARFRAKTTTSSSNDTKTHSHIKSKADTKSNLSSSPSSDHQTLPTFWRLLNNMGAAGCGNLVSSVVFVPKEVLKVRLQLGMGGNVFEASKLIMDHDGWKGLYAGYKATLARNIPSNMLKFMLYEECKRWILKLRHLWSPLVHDAPLTITNSTTSLIQASELSVGEHVVAGALSGMISSSITTPMDLLKTKYASGVIPRDVTIPKAISQIVQTDGIQGLWVGLKSRLIWSALFAALGFTTYEFFKKLLLHGLDTGDDDDSHASKLTRPPSSSAASSHPRPRSSTLTNPSRGTVPAWVSIPPWVTTTRTTPATNSLAAINVKMTSRPQSRRPYRTPITPHWTRTPLTRLNIRPCIL